MTNHLGEYEITLTYTSTGDTELDVIRIIGKALAQLDDETAKATIEYWKSRLDRPPSATKEAPNA